MLICAGGLCFHLETLRYARLQKMDNDVPYMNVQFRDDSGGISCSGDDATQLWEALQKAAAPKVLKPH